MTPYYEEPGITIYCADCRDVLPGLPRGAIVTDPPYGIGADVGVGKYGRLRAAGRTERWDSAASDIGHLLPFQPAIIWGGNYFDLPPSRMFLIWDKGAGFRGRDFAECEMAWCSWDGNAKVLVRDPLASQDYIGKEHPTEKPIPLMTWCLRCLPIQPELVIDPYVGSGSTLVAAKQMAIPAIGIEIEERYCEIAANRLRQEVLPFAEVDAETGPRSDTWMRLLGWQDALKEEALS